MDTLFMAMSPPPLVKLATSSDVATLAPKDFYYAKLLSGCKLKTCKTMVAKLISEKLIGDLDKSDHGTELQVERLRDLFRERSSLLCHDVVEAIKCSEIAQIAIDTLMSRHADFLKQAGLLAEYIPNMADEIDVHLKLVEFQLKTLISESDKTVDDDGLNPVDKFRRWLIRMTDEINVAGHKQSGIDYHNTNDLQTCLSNLQKLQTQLQQEGATLIGSVRKQFQASEYSTVTISLDPNSSAVNQRKRVILSSLERQWHGLWIKCLEFQFKYEQCIRIIDKGVQSFAKSDKDFFRDEPALKRQRLDFNNFSISDDLDEDLESNDDESQTSDTIPFSENEYESFMDKAEGSSHSSEQLAFVASLNLDSDVEYCNDKGKMVYNRCAMVGDNDGILKLKEQGPWDRSGVQVVSQDIGYSSENSVHSSTGSNFTAAIESNEKTNELHVQSIIEPYMVKDNSIGRAELDWSAGSSPCLQRRSRIQKSPLKHYYKMTPLDTDGATDTDTPRSTRTKVSEDSLYVYTKKMSTSKTSSEEPANNLSLNSSNLCDLTPEGLQEIITMLDESYDFEIRGDRDNDLFQQELERFLKDGTTWQPFIGTGKEVSSNKKPYVAVNDNSGDASSELSVDEREPEQNFKHNISSVPPNSPLDVPQGNIRRRRKRSDRSTNLIFKFPSVLPKLLYSASETAVMNNSYPSDLSSSLSMYRDNDLLDDNLSNTMMPTAYCTVPRFGFEFGMRRKKLRARRMPRSMSDGEHLPYLNLNSTRRFVPESTEKSGDDSPEQGPEVPPCTPRNSTDSSSETEQEHDEETCNFVEGGGESMVLDEERIAGDGSSPSTEQSDAVWEWDDYKPLNHKESGPQDSLLDGSTFTEFGDDYLMHMEALTYDSGPLSSRSDNYDNAIPSLTRLPPIGLSHDSDSDLEELCQIIKESQKALRACQQAARQHNVLQQTSWADLMKTCIKHIHCLQTILRQMFNLKGKSSPNHKEYGTVTNLLKLWQELLIEIQSRQPVKDEAWSALQSVMQRLGKSLQNIMEHLSSRNTITTHNSYPIEALQHEINLLKELTNKLKDDRKELDQWISGNVVVGQYCPELQNLARGYVLAVDRCSNQLTQLETLQSQWLDWNKNDNVCKQLLEEINQKLKYCNDVSIQSDVTLVNPDMPQVKGIQNDLELCEDRLNRLETMCNHLTTASGFLDSAVVSDLKRQLVSYSNQLELFKKDFDRLPDVQTFKDRSSSVQNNDCEIVQRKRSFLQYGFTDEPTNAVAQSERISAKNIFLRILSFSWPIQLVLIFFVCLVLYFFQPFCCRTTNNWVWSFGPQLNYVRGPPPT